jgi:hypothetical protein
MMAANDYHSRELTRVLDDVMPRAKNLKEAYNNYYEDEEGRWCEINPCCVLWWRNGVNLPRGSG